MKRKRGVPKAATDIEATAILLPEEQEKPEPEPEDPAVADWAAFAQDHYELVEQLPLSIHRSFSLMRELDDLAQSNTARIVPATKAYIALRDTLAPRPRGHRRTPSGLDLLAHVSAVVEPPAVNGPSLGNGVQELTVDGQIDKLPESAVDPTPVSPELGSTNPLPNVNNTELPNSFPHDTRKLLTLIATLASDAVRASSEKLGIADAVYDSVKNHLTALDALIAQHRSTLPHPPTPTPPLSSPPPAQLVSSPSIKIRTRRRSLQEKMEDGEVQLEEGHQEATIPPLRLTRTPTTIRIRNKPKPKDETRQRSVSMTKNVSNSSSTSKNGPTNNRLPRNPPPTPRKSSNAGAVNNRPPTNKNSKKTATDEVYCVCGQGSFGEMIACDGEGCEREWFHLPCVNLKVAPEGNESWFCSDCTKAGIPANPAKKRRRR
ncbi:Inhibitor of growth protein 3 [Xenopus (Silurana) tropicalis] [Rhizoctonia solani]|uniref:Chromatin modification-related protein n=1 Tax=Rhizoctonia solani TaxID=456999 RepID=A0A0K6GHV2_9AGAM|nr:Inhibitor of growth protein 3 [Xenopus (Silurana) tropicalis] [Rhizoctonia solani]